MCGIVGYIGSRDATPILVNGLRRLEYRGYDSAGVSVWHQGESRVVRCQGKLDNLAKKLQSEPAPGTLGIGHTRWATHGRPSDENAHPHKVGPISVVHNGIIENHLQLRESLVASGATFGSETDTEIFSHLISRELEGAKDLTEAVQKAVRQVHGAYAIVVLNDNDPSTLVCAKNASPMIIGLGEGEHYIASDVTAILSETRDVVFVEEGEVVTVRSDGFSIVDLDGNAIQRDSQRITWSPVEAEKGGYRHFMLKEIHEQPRAIADTLAGRIDQHKGEVWLDGIDLPADSLKRVVLIACGTSYYASLVGEFLVETLARIPSEVDLGSEFRYRDPLVGPGDLVVAISQSGETADTMAAVQEAKAKGAMTLAICNVVGSSIPRLCDHAFYTHAGPEIGVASTKAFTAQLASLVLLAISLGRRNGALSPQRAGELLQELIEIPGKMAEVVDDPSQLQTLAKKYGESSGFFFFGRGNQFPIALEGALKLKEISYIHAEGYAAGELKHGPIALIDRDLPIVALAPRNRHYEKMVSNIAETRAREGKVLAIATVGDEQIHHNADDVFFIPEVAEELQPLLTVLPLQLLAYYVADFKGTDIDQPRNLAKSVTVE